MNLANRQAELAAAAKTASTTGMPAEETSEALQKAQDDLDNAREETRLLQAELVEIEETLVEERRQIELELRAAMERIDVLSEMEESYKRVCDENRQLYNAVQDLKVGASLMLHI